MKQTHKHNKVKYIFDSKMFKNVSVIPNILLIYDYVEYHEPYKRNLFIVLTYLFNNHHKSFYEMFSDFFRFGI